MIQNELEGELVYQPKQHLQKERVPSRGSQQNTESENDMPDIDEDGPPRLQMNGAQRLNQLDSVRADNSIG